MSDPLHQIVLAAAELKLAAPKEFEKLVQSFKVVEESLRTEFYAAGPNVIFTAQGKAGLMVQLHRRLEQCIELRAKYDPRK